MSIAYPFQKFQDWFTQQWVILWGRRIEAKEHTWLVGPFGNISGIGDAFVADLAEKENLLVQRHHSNAGLLRSIHQLKLKPEELGNISDEVIQFYEHTADYHLHINIKWNLFFKLFGRMVNRLFSNRINQLYLPTEKVKETEGIHSEIITLLDPNTNEIKYTVWYRTFKNTGKVIYSGVYGTCTLPTGQECVKAVFPLPNGNATVIMYPKVERNGSLSLNSSGKKFGDAGFYFVLKDTKGNYWSQYLKSFQDNLNIRKEGDKLLADQRLVLWGFRVLDLKYNIERKSI